MGSDLQGIAQRLRELAADTGGTGREVAHTAGDSGKLVERAHAQGRSGLSVSQLVGQLQTAASRSKDAAQALEHIAQHGKAYADHLATAHYNQQGMSLGERVGRALIGAQAVLNFATTPVPDSALSSTVNGEPIDSLQVSKDLAPHAMDATDNQKDLRDALEEADSEKVHCDDGTGRTAGA